MSFDRGTIGFGYHPSTGNLTSLTAPGGNTLGFTYDGSLPKSVTWSGVVNGSTAVTYNSNFQVTGQTVNGGNAISFGYDLDGLLTQAGGLGLRRDVQNGRLVADSVGSQKTEYAYDGHGALYGLVSTRGSDTLLVTGYVRDSLGRITRLVEKVQGVTHDAAFTYDTAGRLKTVTRDSVLAASYSYDLNGNRLSKVGPGGSAAGTYDDQDRMLTYGGASYAYGANGEVRTKVVGTDTTRYTYDALGNLTQVLLPNGSDIEYVIDAQNRRVGKKVNGTLVKGWLYQGQLTPVAELDGAGNVTARFVYATGINVPDYVVKGDSTYRLIRDHLGSVRLVVNVQSGTVAQRIDYDEFGVETQNTNPGWQPFGYAGGLTEAQTGLVRFGVRDYLPGAGRWTAKDPIGFSGGTLELYIYSAGDPVNFLDATGLKVEVLIDHNRWYGHAAVRINGVVYTNGRYNPASAESLGLVGDNVLYGRGLEEYMRGRNTEITGYTLNLTAEQEAQLAAYYQQQMRSSVGRHGRGYILSAKYNMLWNNCSSMVENALESVLPWYADLALEGQSPAELGMTLHFVPGLISATNTYPAGR